MTDTGRTIHLEGHDADDLRRIIAALNEELGDRHAGEAGLTFSILADLPADLGVFRRPRSYALEAVQDFRAEVGPDVLPETEWPTKWWTEHGPKHTLPTNALAAALVFMREFHTRACA